MIIQCVERARHLDNKPYSRHNHYDRERRERERERERARERARARAREREKSWPKRKHRNIYMCMFTLPSLVPKHLP